MPGTNMKEFERKQDFIGKTILAIIGFINFLVLLGGAAILGSANLTETNLMAGWTLIGFAVLVFAYVAYRWRFP